MSVPAPQRKLKVMWLGFRGFPDVQGGVETHAEQICPRLVELGCEVYAVVRAPYMTAASLVPWRGVRYLRLWAPRNRALEALVHTFLGVLVAAWRRPDVLHIQAIGPALCVPLARAFGLRVVFTHHGPDYDRQKWGRFARLTLQLGEWAGARFANAGIAISATIRALVAQKHHRELDLIPNGVVTPTIPRSTDVLQRFGLEPGRFVLIVSRLVPEKRHADLIEAFATAQVPDWKLVIVGAADHRDAYAESVERQAAMTPGVVMTGFQRGVALAELYTHAAVFVLPSSHEGLPIALLEALSYGLPVLASDIPANLEVGLDASQYFGLGDVPALAAALRRSAAQAATPAQRQAVQSWITARYDWRQIAAATLAVYRRIAPTGP